MRLSPEAEVIRMGETRSFEIDLLRSFLLIAGGVSFTHAAERVGRTQAAVTSQIKRLEAMVGHREGVLFHLEFSCSQSGPSEINRLRLVSALDTPYASAVSLADAPFVRTEIQRPDVPRMRG